MGDVLVSMYPHHGTFEKVYDGPLGGMVEFVSAYLRRFGSTEAVRGYQVRRVALLNVTTL
jgi:hypothetical protein